MDDIQLTGKEIDGFRILESIGRGGMGEVFKAVDVALERTVALKLLNPALLQDTEFLERLRQEAKALARLRSPYIVSIYAFRQSEAGFFIVMEYVDGGTLAQLIRRQGALAPEQAIPLIVQMLQALEAAHKIGIIHRDIKPQNILLAADNSVRMTDFGIAKIGRVDKLTQPGQMIGTPQYMSPEQIHGRSDLDHRSDIYSLGMTIYEMLTGRLPFAKNDDAMAIIYKTVNDPLPPPNALKQELPSDISQVVMKALEKEPAKRFQTAEEMRRAIEALDLAHTPRTALSDTAVFVRDKVMASKRKAPAVAALLNTFLTTIALPFVAVTKAVGALISACRRLLQRAPAEAKTGKRRPRAQSREDATLSLLAQHISTSDQPTAHDDIGFKPYVKAIAEFLSHEDTRPPLTLSIEGPWGSGKSSFMLQLKERLSAQGHYTVWFNAWRHENEQALWAAFSLEFVRQLREQRSRLRRWLAGVTLLLRRFSWAEGWFHALRAGAVWLFLVTAAIALPILLFTQGMAWLQALASQLSSSFQTKDQGALQALFQIVLGSGGLSATVALMLTVWLKLRKIVGHPLEIDLRKYLDAPDYKSHVAFIERFHADFKKIIQAFAGDKNVFVFIDDLDRCPATKASNLMQALNLMLAEEVQVYFILGMDREKVAAGLAVKFREVLPFLALSRQTHELANVSSESTSQIGLEHGYNFLEKFVQVPFLIPQPNLKNISRLLDGYEGETPLDIRKPGAAVTSVRTRASGSGTEDDRVTPPAAEAGTTPEPPAENEPRTSAERAADDLPETIIGPPQAAATDADSGTAIPKGSRQGAESQAANNSEPAPGDTVHGESYHSANESGQPERAEAGTQAAPTLSFATELLPTAHRLEERIRQRRRVDMDTQTVRQVVLMVSPALDFNLRRIKQFINLFRLQTYIAIELGHFDNPFDEWATPYQLGKFIAVHLKWPLLLADLAREQTLLTELHNLALRRGTDPDKASERVQRWFRRKKLVELLRSGCLNENQEPDAKLEQVYGLADLEIDTILRLAQDVAVQPRQAQVEDE